MAIAETPFVAGLQSHSASLELNTSVEQAFSLLREVEKWPVWLSFLRSARRQHDEPLGIGSEVIVRSWLPGEAEQLFEVEALIPNYRLALVGAFSMRRRLDFRIEQRSTCAKLHLQVTYPAYHGRVGGILDRWQRGRRLCTALDDSLLHFKGLVEYDRDAAVLADF
jgi:uncharacterized membrane protein